MLTSVVPFRVLCAVITSIPLVVPMYVTACLIICFKPNSKASSHCKHKGVLFHMVKCEGI